MSYETEAAKPLGRFGHHPDPATDFCCEVERLQGLAHEAKCGLIPKEQVADAIAEAMTFRVGGDPWAVTAKSVLRNLEREFRDVCNPDNRVRWWMDVAEAKQQERDVEHQRAERAEARVKELEALLCDANSPLPFSREELGRRVRETWVRWAKEQLNPKPSWLVPWGELSDPDKEVDRRIGEDVARWTMLGLAARAALKGGA